MVPELWSTQTKIFVILDHFLHFYPPNNPKNQNFEKMKKTPGDIIILHKCTINGNHMMYGSWNIRCDRQMDKIFCHFGSFFALLPFNSPKNQNLKKWERCLGISSFYTSVPKSMIICYTIPEIWHVTDLNVIFHFRLFFTLLPP